MVCLDLEAVKYCVDGDWALREKEERLGVLKLEMSLRSEEDRKGVGDGQGRSVLPSSIVVRSWKGKNGREK